MIPILALVEVEYLLRPWTGGFSALMADVGSGYFDVHAPDDIELRRACELVEAYRDLPLGLVDASVLAAVEQLREDKLATLDRRHFSVVRPAHADHLILLPN